MTGSKVTGREIADRIGAMGVEVTDAGMVDDPTKADAAGGIA